MHYLPCCPTQLPKNIFDFGNAEATPSANSAKTFDASALAIVHGPAADGSLTDASASQSSVAGAGITPEVGGVLGSAIKLAGAGNLTVSGPALKLGPTGTTATFWVRSTAATITGSLLKINAEGASLDIRVDAGVLQIVAQGGFSATAATTTAKATAASAITNWSQVALVIGEKAVVSVNGVEVASLAIKPVTSNAQFVLGAGLTADFDELQVFGTSRSPEFLKASFAAQGADGKMVRVEAAGEGGAEAGYMKILIDNLPIDAIIVIVLLAIMLVIATWVVISKAMLISRAGKANAAFLKRYRDLGDKVFVSDQIPSGISKGGYADSTLYHVFDRARVAMLKRVPGGKGKLESRNMPAIKSAVDTAVVGQNSKMNRWMVLLTIAISGGPFLGLLGTVVGVMITFAAIAAVGDVNINAIAPGIAAALLATVAGLAVAIPALFAYNYLASAIKEVTTETAVFGEEVISDMSETHGV